MTTSPVVSITDELIAELEAAADQVLRLELSDEPGIGDAYDAHESAASPATIKALLAERADLKRQLAAASVDAERWRYAKYDTSTGKSDICVVKKIWGDGRKDTQEIILTEADADAAVDAARDIAGSD